MQALEELLGRALDWQWQDYLVRGKVIIVTINIRSISFIGFLHKIKEDLHVAGGGGGGLTLEACEREREYIQ